MIIRAQLFEIIGDYLKRHYLNYSQLFFDYLF